MLDCFRTLETLGLLSFVNLGREYLRSRINQLLSQLLLHGWGYIESKQLHFHHYTQSRFSTNVHLVLAITATNLTTRTALDDSSATA